MKNATFSRACVDMKANAALGLLSGGWLYLYDGPKPKTADNRLLDGENTVLAKLKFGEPAFSESRNGMAEAYAFAPCLGEVFGTATWFRAYTTGMTPIFDGTVGPRPESPEQQDYDMYLSGDIFEGGEVIVDRFIYREDKG